MEANTTIVLYKPATKVIVAELYKGEKYQIPETVSIYVGTLSSFRTKNPDYQFETDLLTDQKLDL